MTSSSAPSTAGPTGFRWPHGYAAAAAFTFDLDAETAILSGDHSAAFKCGLMSHQAYGPLTGAPRLLRMLARNDIRATFFVPGWVAYRYPDVVRAIIDGGHEIGHHGYLHEHVDLVDESTELEYLERGLTALDEVAHVRPTGYRAPGAEMNYRTPQLLAAHGFHYDSSLMDMDVPYVIETDDGRGLVEIPIQWALDDWQQYAFMPGYEGSGVIESPSKALEMWAMELDALREEGGCFVLVNHPLLSGRPSRAKALEQLIQRARSFGDVWVTSLGDIAEHVRTLRLEPRRLEPPDLGGGLKPAK
jgi:peptidoglycan/xylan/chitin deacetylase (PgdA/CDA1 family)